jgi:hypothetical protein
MSDIVDNWHEQYLGKPWEGSPKPPRSYNCGELVRHVYIDLHGIDSAMIPAKDANIHKESIKAMLPTLYGLELLTDPFVLQDFDVCFLGKSRYIDHCGIGTHTADGYMILHCQQVAGVGMDSPAEMAAIGYTRQVWARHPKLWRK